MAESNRQAEPERLLAETRWMRSLARELLGGDALADDVVQDAWVAALRRPPRASGGRGLRAWLAAVVGNLARRARRCAGRWRSAARAAMRSIRQRI